MENHAWRLKGASWRVKPIHVMRTVAALIFLIPVVWGILQFPVYIRGLAKDEIRVTNAEIESLTLSVNRGFEDMKENFKYLRDRLDAATIKPGKGE